MTALWALLIVLPALARGEDEIPQSSPAQEMQGSKAAEESASDSTVLGKDGVPPRIDDPPEEEGAPRGRPRAVRRSPRRDRDRDDAEAASSSSPEESSDAPAVSRSRERTLRGLRRVRDELEADGPAEADAGLPSAGGGTPAARPRGADFTAPSSPEQLLQAHSAGLTAPFRDMGLVPRTDAAGGTAIARNDGSPASAREVAELSRRVAAEPLALTRRRDFFAVLPRARFEALKQAHAALPGLRDTAFKDVALSSGSRDFVWSASCGPLSEECNASARPPSYKAGAFVSPEDLRRIDEAAASSAAAPALDGSLAAHAAAARRALGGGSASAEPEGSAPRRRLGAFWSAVSRAFGGGSAEASGEPAPGLRAADVPGPEVPPARTPRGWWWLLALPPVVLLARGLRRRR